MDSFSRNMYPCVYSGTSVHELNSFLEAVREPKCSQTETKLASN
jgi:hypothetical protein